MEIDHLGIMVPDLSKSLIWWLDALPGWQVEAKENWQTANADALGMTGDVHICGAIVRPPSGASGIELHQVGPPHDARSGTRRTHDFGLGHFALRVPRADLNATGARLASLGVDWLSEVKENTDGPTRGVRWRYGRPPLVAGDVLLEIRSAAPSSEEL